MEHDAPLPVAPRAPFPCVARPSTGFVHLDGPCRCFVGGPPPEFPAVEQPEAARPHPSFSGLSPAA